MEPSNGNSLSRLGRDFSISIRLPQSSTTQKHKTPTPIPDADNDGNISVSSKTAKSNQYMLVYLRQHTCQSMRHCIKVPCTLLPTLIWLTGPRFSSSPLLSSNTCSLFGQTGHKPERSWKASEWLEGRRYARASFVALAYSYRPPYQWNTLGPPSIVVRAESIYTNTYNGSFLYADTLKQTQRPGDARTQITRDMPECAAHDVYAWFRALELLLHCTCWSRLCTAVAAAATITPSLRPKTSGTKGRRGKGFGDRQRDEIRASKKR